MRQRVFLAMAMALVLACGAWLLPVLAGDGLDGIPRGRILIGAETHVAHIADDSRERGQGFQNVSAETIREAMIYFQFPRPVVPRFHMRNVAAPLAIAWIDENARVVGVSVMEPERTGYRPPGPVVAALELHPQRARALGIQEGTVIRRVSE